jgi:hypothetical protein
LKKGRGATGKRRDLPEPEAGDPRGRRPLGCLWLRQGGDGERTRLSGSTAFSHLNVALAPEWMPTGPIFCRPEREHAFSACNGPGPAVD